MGGFCYALGYVKSRSLKKSSAFLPESYCCEEGLEDDDPSKSKRSLLPAPPLITFCY
jgi:hypothetical protein